MINGISWLEASCLIEEKRCHDKAVLVVLKDSVREKRPKAKGKGCLH